MKTKGLAGDQFEDAMGKNDDRVQWSQVSGVPELWASECGQIATLAPGGGFAVLKQYFNVDGKPHVWFLRDEGKHRSQRLVARLVLCAFVERCGNAQPITYADGDVGNCRLGNLSWRRGGAEPAVGNCKPRRCLGNHCGHCMFMSIGLTNRLCPICTGVNSRSPELDGVHEPDAIPDAPSLYPPRGAEKR